MTPSRIQRSRAKGSKLPADCVCVTRPGPWGNPWYVISPKGMGRWVVCNQGFMLGRHTYDTKGQATAVAVELHTTLMNEMTENDPEHLDPLRGKHLACWCKLCEAHKQGKPFGVVCKDCAPCHADVLGCMANGIEVPS